MRSIVLGANGYLGRHLVHLAGAGGQEVLAIDMNPPSTPTGVPFMAADVADANRMRQIDWNVDVVHVFAGLTGTHDGFDAWEPFVRTNEIGLLNVLGAVRASGHRPRVVFPSTRLVYRGSDVPIREGDAKDPRTVYAINKLACEHALHAYANAFGIPFTVYRICVPYGNLVGTGQSFGTLGAMLRQARGNGVIRLYGDGSLRRTFTHVEDICRPILASALDPRTVNGTYNVPGEALSLREAAEEIARRHGAGVEFVPWPERDLRIESGSTVFDGRDLEAIVGVGPRHAFQSWVRAT
jgi:UDP-glucose 4-epimerase